MAGPITEFRSVRVNPGNLYVGDGTPSTAVNGSDVYIEGTLEVDGALDIDGALALGNTLTVGVDGTGYDVTFYGDTSGSLMQWDESDDRLEMTQARLSFGTLSSTEQTGYTLTSSHPNVLAVFADDGDATLGDAVYGTILARTMLFNAVTAGTVRSVVGQLKLADEADLGPGVFAGVQGYIELYDDADVKSGGKVWGVDASIEAPTSGILTVDSGGICAGLHAELTGAGQATQSSGGILAGLYVDEQITTGQWGYGIYIADGAAATGIYVGGTISATDGRAMKISTTQATPAMADGYGVIEKELTVSGTATGMINAESSWINLGTSAVVPSYCHVHNDGVWDGTATLTNAYISWAKFQCLLESNPARVSLWELNFSGANSEVNALFSINDATLALGYQAGTPTKAAVGSIPFFIDSNGTVYYIYIYDAADSD